MSETVVSTPLLMNRADLPAEHSKRTGKDGALQAMTGKRGKSSFLSNIFKTRGSILSSVLSMIWGGGERAGGEDVPGPVDEASNEKDKDAKNSQAYATGRRTRRSSTLSSSSIATTYDFGRTSTLENDFRLKLPVADENAASLEIDATENEVLDVELAFRAIVHSINTRLVFRLRKNRDDSVEMFAMDDANRDISEALFIIFISPDMRNDDNAIPVAAQERAFQLDPARAHAITVMCFESGLNTQIIYSKRTSKGVETKVSDSFSLFCVEEPIGIELDEMKRRLRVHPQAMAAMRWSLKEIVVCMTTSKRLSSFGIKTTKFLGAGSTAVVCEADVVIAGKTVRAAVKVIDSVDVFNREAKLLKAVRGCEGVPTLIGSIPDLKTIATFPVGIPLHRTKIGAIRTGAGFAPVVRGLRALRSKGIVHRDVSPGNMIVVSSEPSELGLIDLGMAQRFSNHPRSYSGARSFASDRISGYFASNKMSWSDSDVQFAYEDDLESLIKTAVWTLDGTARRMINECAGKKKLQPNDVYAMWQRVWTETSIGKEANQFLELNVRPLANVADLDADHLDVLYSGVCDWIGALTVTLNHA